MIRKCTVVLKSDQAVYNRWNNSRIKNLGEEHYHSRPHQKETLSPSLNIRRESTSRYRPGKINLRLKIQLWRSGSSVRNSPARQKLLHLRYHISRIFNHRSGTYSTKKVWRPVAKKLYSHEKFFPLEIVIRCAHFHRHDIRQNHKNNHNRERS